jgi:hypothetical protein
MTGAKLVDRGSLIMQDCPSLKGYIDASSARGVPARNEAKVEPLAANIFIALIEEGFSLLVITGDLQPTGFVSQCENRVIGKAR